MTRIATVIAVLLALASTVRAQVYDGQTYRFGSLTYTWSVTAPNNGTCSVRCTDSNGNVSAWQTGATPSAASSTGKPGVQDCNPMEMRDNDGNPTGVKVDVTGGAPYGSSGSGAFLQMRPPKKERGKSAASWGMPTRFGAGLRGDDVETVPGSNTAT